MVIMSLAALLLCGSAWAADYPLTITDSTGRNVTFQMPVERIIVLNSNVAEALEALGAGDKIVGVVDTVQKLSWYFPDLKNKELVGKWSAPDYEAIAQIAKGTEDRITPNIVIMGYASGTYSGKSYGVDAVSEGLKSFPEITILALDCYKEATLDEDLAKLGMILGKEENAEKLIAWRKAKKDDVTNAVSRLSKPKVYAEGTLSLKTNGAPSEINKNIELAGGSNIYGSSNQESFTTSWEDVITKNPDIILRLKSDDMMGWGASPSLESISAQTVRNEILSRTGGTAISAIKPPKDEDKKVWIVWYNMIFGPDNVVGLTYMAKLYHPEIDLDPVSVHKEWLDFIGVKYPEKRTFVYPELASDS
jgi:iron complex transport system substrate-binding protein